MAQGVTASQRAEVHQKETSTKSSNKEEISLREKKEMK
jgi:hypothetical protein